MGKPLSCDGRGFLNAHYSDTRSTFCQTEIAAGLVDIPVHFKYYLASVLSISI